MNSWHKLGDYLVDNFKGITPKYVEDSQTIVLNQKCIRANSINFELARFHSDEKSYNPKKILKVGDLLFNSTGQGTAGRCAFVRNLPDGKRVITDSHILILRLSNVIIAECFSYLFYSKEKFFQTFMDGSTGQGELDKLRLFNVEFRIPEIDIARAICKLFNDLDAKIELNNEINTELEAIAKLVYDYWFVQFDFPDPNGKPYKSSGGKMTYNEELKREIPVGWNVGTISNFIANDKSGDWGKETAQGNYTTEVNCVRGADINGINGKGAIKAPRRFILEKNEHKILEPYDLVVEISGGSPTQSTGRLAHFTEHTLERFENPLICSNFCRALTLKNKEALYNFSFLWQRLYDAGVLFGWEGKTSGIKNLLFDSFINSYTIAIPTDDVISNFFEFMIPIQEKLQNNLKENQELAELRDWLLPMLMNGQVSVGEGYDMVEEKLGMVAEGNEKYGESNI